MPTPRANKEFLKALEADCLRFLQQAQKWRDRGETTAWSDDLKKAVQDLRLSAKLVQL